MARVRFDFSSGKRKLRRFRSLAGNLLQDQYKQEILKEIEGGRSPVKGEGRFPRYSDSYRDSIKRGQYSRFSKRRSPVNLKLTGELLNSLSVTLQSKKLLIIFDNFLADIHNRQGAGKSKTVRRMLPTKQGESFSRNITIAIQKSLQKLANRIFK